MLKFFKRIIIENYLYFSFLFVFTSIMFFPVKYYIYTGGGIIDTNDRILFFEGTKEEGSYNLCYVKSLNANIMTFLLSKVLPGWDLEKKEENIKTKEEDYRDKLYLDIANNNALYNALKLAGSNYKVNSDNLVVMYIYDKANTDIHIGDIIKEIDNIKMNSLDDIKNYLDSKDENDLIKLKVINNNKEYERFAYLYKDNNSLYIGISFERYLEVSSDYNIKFDFRNVESGPSGGLMLSLSIYDKLIKEDLTKGRKICGTGVINYDGTVSPIGGVKYKLKGAVNSNCDLFLVPSEINYKEALKYKKDKNYNIELVAVSNINDAVNYLKK